MMLAIFAVFITWSLLDVVIHGIILSSAYAASPQLWRPREEMKMGLMYVTVLTKAAVFVSIFTWWISDKGMKSALSYGLLFGIGTGISMGYGSYAVMPMPYFMAMIWFLGTIVESVAAGWITGLIAGNRA